MKKFQNFFTHGQMVFHTPLISTFISTKFDSVFLLLFVLQLCLCYIISTFIWGHFFGCTCRLSRVTRAMMMRAMRTPSSSSSSCCCCCCSTSSSSSSSSSQNSFLPFVSSSNERRSQRRRNTTTTKQKRRHHKTSLAFLGDRRLNDDDDDVDRRCEMNGDGDGRRGRRKKTRSRSRDVRTFSSSSSSSSNKKVVSAATAFENATTSVSIDWNSQIRKAKDERVGVLLLNLGGPETLDDVEPFLFNLFADPDIIRLPSTSFI